MRLSVITERPFKPIQQMSHGGFGHGVFSTLVRNEQFIQSCTDSGQGPKILQRATESQNCKPPSTGPRLPLQALPRVYRGWPTRMPLNSLSGSVNCVGLPTNKNIDIGACYHTTVRICKSLSKIPFIARSVVPGPLRDARVPKTDSLVMTSSSHIKESGLFLPVRAAWPVG